MRLLDGASRPARAPLEVKAMSIRRLHKINKKNFLTDFA